jgi:hydroxymethylpyrimidine/phosphomethylpyrimidine kinase
MALSLDMGKYAVTYPPVALAIAGNDPSGGAGVQADLKTFAAQRVYGAGVITALTVQNTLGVTACHPVAADIVDAQLAAVLDDLPVRAIKVGMLARLDILRVVAARLQALPRDIAVVVDPVLAASDGTPLLEPAALSAVLRELLPLATLLTPNLPEAAILLGRPISDPAEAAQALLETGAGAVLLKGGHETSDELVDYLAVHGEASVQRFPHPRVATRHTHGTGCSLSAAITAGLARGLTLEDAVSNAIAWLQGALTHAYPVGRGNGPVHHFWEIWPC